MQALGLLPPPVSDQAFEELFQFLSLLFLLLPHLLCFKILVYKMMIS